jgi:hypothetical protein
VSLHERNLLENETAKILHAWLCSNIRLGQSLGKHGNGAHIDTLAPHVWGAAHNDESAKVRSVRRSLLSAALEDIADKTTHLNGGHGWVIDKSSDGLVLVSRPKTLPKVELITGMTPGELDAAASGHYDYEKDECLNRD